MKTMRLGRSDLFVPPLAVGCMRLNRLNPAEATYFLHSALDLGLNFFDHADIYGDGSCEEQFSRAIHISADLREKIILQSKCGICKGYYDFSRAHILAAVDGILQRLQTDYLDVLLLHRPDALMEPEEVADAFDQLHASGKVRYFGVSNQKPAQIKLLQQSLRQPLLVDQLQLSLPHAGLIANGLNVNMLNAQAADHDGSILDFCRLQQITVQAWSPMQYGFFEGVFLGNPKFAALNQVISRLAAQYQVPDSSIALAWILRHPAHIQPVTGTMNLAHLKASRLAADLTLTRPEWYELYQAAGYELP
ncbi:MAG: aldo/keto reductase [Oscillospiraceae bacterium]|nr:aldo/keto reductase [Oscillospiraceae bacterium]MDD4367845.1 aldo/keto reductase [Oscillospiraceae bacterium]